jgi:osmotically-inducible protein OsmY
MRNIEICSFNRRGRLLAAGVLWLALASPAAASEASDAWLTTKVKTALVAADGVEGFDVNVDAFDGLITLHGIVASDAERTRASAAAAEVEGVRGVRDLLAVVPELQRASVRAADRELAAAVEDALAADPALADGAIEVRSVHGGTVLLGGRAESIEDHRRALEVARGVAAARRVASAIHSPNARADAELWERDGIVSNAPPGGLRRMASDTWITTKAKLQLLRALDLSPFSVRVDTSDGVVSVAGVVASGGAKSAAETLLMEIDGVREVENYLQVVPEIAARGSESPGARTFR